MGLAGQVLTMGAALRMAQYLCWARADQFLENGGGNFCYLPFDLPPSPPGTIIRVSGVGSCSTSGAATGTLRVGVSDDWNATSPGIIGSMASTPDGLAASQTGVFHLQVGVRSRTASTGNGGFVGGAAANATTTAALDFQRTQRCALYIVGLAATNTLISHAMVEVYVPRVYR